MCYLHDKITNKLKNLHVNISLMCNKNVTKNGVEERCFQETHKFLKISVEGLCSQNHRSEAKNSEKNASREK